MSYFFEGRAAMYLMGGFIQPFVVRFPMTIKASLCL